MTDTEGPFGKSARILPASTDSLSGEQSKIIRNVPRAHGNPYNIYLTLVHNPDLLRQIMNLANECRFGTLGGFDREMVILATASYCESEYLFCEHLPQAKKEGVSDAQIKDIRVQTVDPSLWSQDQAGLLGFVREITLGNTISDIAWKNIPLRDNPSFMIDLIILIGFYSMIAKFTNAVKMEIDLTDGG